MLCSPKRTTLHNYHQQLMRSLSLSQKQPERILQHTRPLEESTDNIQGNPSLKLSKVVKKRSKIKQKSTFWPKQLKRIIQSNILTINISEKSNKQDYGQLQKQNFEQLQSQLVRESVFEYYRELNQRVGDPEEHILKQYRLQQQSQIKFKLDPQFKIKTRKNIYQKQAKQNKRSQSTSLPSHLSHQLINNVTLKSSKPNPKVRLSEKFHWRKEKWKLTDFFNSIVSEQEKVDQFMEHHRLRIELATQFSKIDKRCEQQEQNEHQRHLFETFQKYSEKVNDKLHKKQRRLSKVKFLMRNGLS